MGHLMLVTTGVVDHSIVGPEQRGTCPLGELTGRRKKHMHVGEGDSQKSVDVTRLHRRTWRDRLS